MGKFLNYSNFQRFLDNELIWRRMEISDLKQAVKDASLCARPSLLRAFLPVVYAHWEGSTVNNARAYFRYISERRILLKDLSMHHGNLIFLKRIEQFSSGRIALDEKLNFLSEIRRGDDLRLTKIPHEVIETGSNLNCERMRSICKVCGVNSQFLNGYEDFLDVRVLRRRNQIAHGEWASINFDEMDEITDVLFSLIKCFQNELVNIVALKQYRSPH